MAINTNIGKIFVGEGGGVTQDFRIDAFSCDFVLSLVMSLISQIVFCEIIPLNVHVNIWTCVVPAT